MQGIVVFKCGGSAVEELSDDFFRNLMSLKAAGMKLVIVHGGGPAIGKMLDRLHMTYEFSDGLRKTTEEMMAIVEMVLVGKVNSRLTSRVNQQGLMAVGLSGSDCQLLEAIPIDYKRYGLVGEVSRVNVQAILSLLQIGMTPVISPIAMGRDQCPYNINADTAAGAIASALRAEQLIFVTDVSGIFKGGQCLEKITTTDIKTYMEDGTIQGGMIPKVKAALQGLTNHVKEVRIVNGKQSELTDSEKLAGTTITVPMGVTE